MKLSKLNPFIRYAGLQVAVPRRTQYSQCYDCRFFFIEEGEGTMLIEGKCYSISKNKIVYLPSGTRYAWGFESKNFRIYVFDFDLTDKYSNIAETLGTPTDTEYNEKYRIPHPEELETFSVPLFSENSRCLSECKRITSSFITKNPFYLEKSSALLKLCLIEIAEKNEPEKIQHPVVKKVCNYLHENYADPELSNINVAMHFGYHPYYLGRVFTKVMGIPIHQYLLHYRLRIAENFLISTDYEISDVSWRCGFSSISYFIKRFREENGETPATYRKNHFRE